LTSTDHPIAGWAAHLDRQLLVKTQFILHGNIYDRFPCMLKLEPDDPGQWNYLTLRDYLRRFLTERGYQNIGFYDLVDGIQCDTPTEVRELREQIAAVDHCSETDESETDDRSESDRDIDDVRTAVVKLDTPTVFVIDFASRLLSHPDHLTRGERKFWLTLNKCAQDARRVLGENGLLRNLTILICDKLNDLPPWLYLRNPLVHPVEIDLPDDDERRRYFEIGLHRFHGAKELSPETRQELTSRFVGSSRGLCNYDLQNLQAMSVTQQVAIRSTKDVSRLVDLYKFGVRENPWERLESKRLDMLTNAHEELRKSVKGQERAISAVVDILKRAVMGLSGVQHSSGSHKPRGVLFFAGPTGVGKTELAKSLARLLFADENACVRFDMSEYSSSHADQKLMGAPPGYVGYAAGGQLTNAVRSNPFSVLLFDEIEKADPSILDKFLQILEDGRMTDGMGQTVYFSETIIIFTSNLGTYVSVRDEVTGQVERKANVLPELWQCRECGRRHVSTEKPPHCEDVSCAADSLELVDTPYDFLERRILEAIEQAFKIGIGRPELFNRIGNNFVVFDYIRAPVLQAIILKNLDSIACDLADRRKVHVEFSEQVVQQLVDWTRENLDMGARGVGNLIETRLVNPLARHLFDSQVESGSRITVEEIVPGEKPGEACRLELSDT